MITTSAIYKTFRLQSIASAIESGTGTATVALFDGARPATVEEAPASTPLVQIPLAKPVGVIENGHLTLAAGGNGQVLRSGLAAWARLYNCNGDALFDCDVGLEASSAEIKVRSTSLYAGAEVSLVSAVFG